LYRQRSLEVSFDRRGQMGDYWNAEQLICGGID
jgi:hypothetical protein